MKRALGDDVKVPVAETHRCGHSGDRRARVPDDRRAESLAGTIHQTVVSVDLALLGVKLPSMDEAFAWAIGRPRLLTQLLGIFAGLALLLAAIGSGVRS